MTSEQGRVPEGSGRSASINDKSLRIIVFYILYVVLNDHLTCIVVSRMQITVEAQFTIPKFTANPDLPWPYHLPNFSIQFGLLNYD